MENNEYSKSYSELSFFDKILECAKKAGITTIYAALLLYYTLKKPLTPGWAKTTIIGALGYLISPLDAIPDVTPIVGYSDDLGALALALVAVSMFIDDEVKQNAKAKLREWFGEYDESDLEDIDNKIK
jgi:Uncharacterized conserved protein